MLRRDLADIPPESGNDVRHGMISYTLELFSHIIISCAWPELFVHFGLFAYFLVK